MKLTLLGTGTPAPSLSRQSSGYLLQIGDDVIVLDHGPGAAHRLLEAGRTPMDVSHVFLTHLHYDHIADFPRLLLQHWDHGADRVPDLEVVGPSPVAKFVTQLFGQDGVYGPDLAARTQHEASQAVYQARGGKLPRKRPNPHVSEVKPGDVIEGNSWRAIAGQAVHFQPFLECLGYRFECDAGVVVYSGDSGGVLDSMIELARDCDVLIHMCHFETGTEPSPFFRETNGSHMDVAEIARRAGVKTLVLTHFPPPMDAPGLLERLVGEMSRVYDGNIIIGRDLLEVPIHIAKNSKFD
ncbi:MAG: MBL fold metallo-hydrolase [Alphaproteobacteria bacterium]|nr:MBL fold metallo-hydrolase [Alphaproteobacteria bacterium]